MYRCVIFDFDGTLADTFPWFVRTANEAAGRFGFAPIEAAALDALRRGGARQLLAHVGLAPARVPQVARFMRERMAAQACELRLFDGVDRTLAMLAARGVRRAVLTSNARANVERVLGPANVARVNDFATGASLFGKAAKFRRLLDRAGLRPAEALYVGDETRDAEAARAAGVAFAGVAWGYGDPETLAAVSDVPLLTRLDDLAERLAAG